MKRIKSVGLALALIVGLILGISVSGYAETDVTSKVQVIKGALSYDRVAKQSYLNVSVKNISGGVLFTPIDLVLDSVTPSAVKVANADGVFENVGSPASPFISFTTTTGQLLPGATTAVKKLVFENPTAAKFSYKITAIGALPQASGDIGPLGGTIQILEAMSPFDRLSLVVPADALKVPVTIAIGKTDENQPPVGGLVFSGNTLKLSPSGQVFNEPIIIKIPYNKNSGIPVIFSYSEITGKHEILPFVDIDDVNGFVSVQTTHFSLLDVLDGLTLPPPSQNLNSGFDLNSDSFRAVNNGAYLQNLPERFHGGVCWGFANFSKWYFENKKQVNGPLKKAYGATGDGCNQILVAAEAWQQAYKYNAYELYLAGNSVFKIVPDSTVFKQIYFALKNNGGPQLLSMRDFQAPGAHAVLVTSIEKIDESSWGLNIYDNTDNEKYHKVFYKFDPSKGFDSGKFDVYQLGNHYFFTNFMYPGEQGILKDYDMNIIHDKYSNASCFSDSWPDLDRDGFNIPEGDTDDNNPTVYPGATDICGDHLDNNGSGTVDEGCVTWYADKDGDGYGDPLVTRVASTKPTGYVANNADCNDNDPTIHPGGTEIPGDGIDQDCSGTDQAPDVTPGTFAATGSMGVARHSHGSTLMQNGNVLVTGGYINNTPTASSEIYSPSTRAFAPTGSLATSRHTHTETLLPDGKVLITGGVGYNNVFLSSCEVYDPLTGSFSTAGSLKVARAWHTATLLGNGKVLIVGGQGGSFSFNSAEIYDPATHVSNFTGNMLYARDGHQAILLQDGKVFISGGYTGGGTSALSTTEIYDPTVGTFTKTATMNSPRLGHTATMLPDGNILIAGGLANIYTQFLNSAEIYHPSNNSFIVIGNLNAARGGHTATLLGDGRVLIAGGRTQSTLNSAELFNSNTRSFTVVTNMNNERVYHTATLLDNDKVLIIGGNNGSVSLSSTELYTP